MLLVSVFLQRDLDFRFVGDLHQLASSANICAEVPSIGGEAIEIGVSYYFLWHDQLWVPFFNMVAFTLGVSQFDSPIKFYPTDSFLQTYFNTKVKVAQLKAARKAQKDKDNAKNKGPVA